MFLKWSTSLSTLLKKQLSVIGALFIFISQVSLSHLNQWLMSYLIFYGGSLELLFWQLFLFSFHFFFLLCFWVFNNLFIFLTRKHRTCLRFLFRHTVFTHQSCVQPQFHHMLLCPHLCVQLCPPLHPLQMLPVPPIWAFLPCTASCSHVPVQSPFL